VVSAGPAGGGAADTVSASVEQSLLAAPFVASAPLKLARQ
jgi:hypothetical protein